MLEKVKDKNPEDVANPCGIMVKYFPKDRYNGIQFIDDHSEKKIKLIHAFNIADPYMKDKFKK